MNNSCLVGNLTKDPELTNVGSQNVAVCKFTIAVNRKFADANGNRQADFLPIVTWRKTAENCAKFLKKGSKVGVVGEIQTRSYDAQDGTKRYVTEIHANDVEFLSPRGEGQPGANGDDMDGGMSPVSDDTLPF